MDLMTALKKFVCAAKAEKLAIEFNAQVHTEDSIRGVVLASEAYVKALHDLHTAALLEEKWN